VNIAHVFVRDKRLRSGWRVTLYLICYLLGLLIVQAPIVGIYGAYLVLRGLTAPASLMQALQPSQLPIWFVAALKGGELLMVLVLTYLVGRFVDRRPFAAFGFRPVPGWAGDLVLGTALGAAQMVFVLTVEWAGGWLSVSVPDPVALVKGLLEVLFGVGLFAAVAVGEELVFRGYVQTNLREGAGLPVALACSSVLFGLFHAMNPNLTPVALLNLVLAGLAMGYGYVVTGNLWLPIAYHFAWNLTQGPVLGLPVSGMRYGGLLTVNGSGTGRLITGGAFGPEGGVLGTLVLLSAFPVFWWWGRKRQKADYPSAVTL
jgi:membrane protease YdiL (CAAX protease family)